MAQEIERKFLVGSNTFKAEASRQIHIKQAYLSSLPERSVRIRIKGEKAFITIKGKGNAAGISRYEWEKEIPVNEANELLQLCEPGMIDKIRYEVQVGKHLFEVDVFFGENEGLVVAEVELKSEDEQFQKPAWLGEEVTGQRKYYNATLKKNPFSTWEK